MLKKHLPQAVNPLTLEQAHSSRHINLRIVLPAIYAEFYMWNQGVYCCIWKGDSMEAFLSGCRCFKVAHLDINFVSALCYHAAVFAHGYYDVYFYGYWVE